MDTSADTYLVCGYGPAQLDKPYPLSNVSDAHTPARPHARASRRNTVQQRRIPACRPAGCRRRASTSARRRRASVPNRRPPATGFCPCDMDLAPKNSREFTPSRSPLPLQFVAVRFDFFAPHFVFISTFSIYSLSAVQLVTSCCLIACMQ